MAGVRVTVCLPPSEGIDLRTRLAAALGPFEAGVGNSWEREQWDWWTIRGGSDRSGFWIADGADEALLVHDDPYEPEPASPSKPGRCAGGPKQLLDLGRPRRDAARHAADASDTWHRLAPLATARADAGTNRAVARTRPRRTPRARTHASAQHRGWCPGSRGIPGPAAHTRGPGITRLARDRALGRGLRRPHGHVPRRLHQPRDQPDRPEVRHPDSRRLVGRLGPAPRTRRLRHIRDLRPHLADPDRPTPAELTRYLEQLPDDTLLVQLKAHG